MSIFDHLNPRSSYDETRLCPGGEEKIEEVIRTSPVPLPPDYIELLKKIPGENNQGIVGMNFLVNDMGDLLYFFGESPDGFGLYVVVVTSL